MKRFSQFLLSRRGQWAYGSTILLLLLLVGIAFATNRVCIHRPPATPAHLNWLANSIRSFEVEYGKPPDVQNLDFETEGPQAVKFLTILLGKEDTGPEMQNPRQVAFLTARNTKNRKMGGLVYNSPENKIQGMYDAWGNPLRVILRPPGKVATTISYRGKQLASYQPAVVLSRGPDQQWGTEDDLISASDER